MKKIGIVFGSLSFEHEISIVSAIAMKDVIKKNLFYIFIDKHREFYQIPVKKIKSSLFSSSEYKKCEKLDLSKGGFYKKSMFGAKKIELEYVLNLVHGQDGEDGVMASLFEFFDVAFVGPRVEASVISYSKYFTKFYAQTCGVKTLDFKFFNKNSRIVIKDYPIIVKPTHLGSSIGISIVKEQNQLNYALDSAFEFDDEIIIESFIKDIKEYNLAGCKCGNEFLFSIVEEPNKDEFLDFDKKYLDFNRTDKVKKATIDMTLEFKLKQAFKKLYNNTFEGALIRCDFFIIDKEVYINEINPIPGSMANYLFDDFNTILEKLSNSQPKKKLINITYEYVNKIQKAKGKV
jgi:D-alanine-D-alanine ligase